MKNRILLSIGLICSFMGMNIMEGMGQCSVCSNTCTVPPTASGTCSFSTGENSVASGFRSVAVGLNTSALGSGSFAIGPFSVAGTSGSSSGGWAFGYEAQALADESFAFGSNIQANALQNMVIGMGTYPYLINDIEKSLMIGMNSNVPTFYMSDAGGGTNALSNIGIATNAPSARMHINGALRLGKTDSTTTGILEFENTTNANVFSITSGATTGGSFGWLLPDAQGGLDEVLTNDGFGGLSWAVPNTSTTAWQLLGNASTNPSTNYIGTSDGQHLSIRTAGAEKIRVETGGNVGIGTSAPDGLLHLNATNTYMIVEKGIDNEGGVVWHNGPQSAGTANASLMFETDETLRLRNAMINENVVINVNDGGTNREAIFVEGTSAHVGIGTSNPVTRLHVVALAATVIPDDETIARFAVSDNDTAFIQLENIDDTNGHFAGGIRSISSTADNSALLIAAAVHPTLDTGSEPMMIFSPRRLGSTNITTRPLFEWANNTSSKMLMDAGGNLGIGTTSPSGKLHVNGSLFAGLTFDNSAPSMVLYDSSTDELFDGGVSSMYFKDNINNLEFDTIGFMNLRPVSFNWKPGRGGRPDVGLIAQEVEEVFPQLAYSGYKMTYLENGEVLRDSLGRALVDSTQMEVRGVKYHKLPIYLLAIARSQQEQIKALQESLLQVQESLRSCCGQDPNAKVSQSEENLSIPTRNLSMEEFILLQNDPNPFDDFTDISYKADGCEKCHILITDMNGRIVKRIPVYTNQGVIRVYSSEIGKGLFSYSIIKDGTIVKTAKMVSTR